ncbi:MAG: U32 family peptidase [Puniceicoccales bacterium]|jgi:putative protease|nr:U32 family peptidase [Puniceicoccales bacterium]
MNTAAAAGAGALAPNPLTFQPAPVPPVPPLPELLAPAGDFECARAAVENGADAVYFGAGRLNARVRAANFTLEDLPALMRFLHRRGVAGHLALNTLVFTSELDEARETLRAAAAAGVDAVIIQDPAVFQLAREVAPALALHASTQMTITGAAGIRFARELGASRVVLARECPLADIAAACREGAAAGVEIEVFIHGALCVAYSGQCLTSEALGGRSANRGECAQACRMPYELVADGAVVPLGDRRYLLSPRDLAGMELLPELAAAGVRSLKIEGRLKSPEYVAAVTGAYRAALDDLANAAAHRRAADYTLQMAFSRGLGTGWLRGVNNRELVHARFGKKRGVLLGEVTRVEPAAGAVTLRKLAAPAAAGDGVVFDAGNPDAREEGGFLHAVEKDAAGGARLRLAREALDWRRVRAGQRVWKTADPALAKRLRATYAGDAPRYRRPVDARVAGAAGEPLRAEFDDLRGHCVAAVSDTPLAPATGGGALTADTLRAQLGRLGGTGYFLRELDTAALGSAPLMLPLAELNRLRRRLVEALDAARERAAVVSGEAGVVSGQWSVVSEEAGVASGQWSVVSEEVPVSPSLARSPTGETSLTTDHWPLTTAGGAAGTAAAAGIPLARTVPQLAAALAWGAREVYGDFENLRDHADAARLARDAGATYLAAPPRIFKTGEDYLLDRIGEVVSGQWSVTSGKVPVSPSLARSSLEKTSLTTDHRPLTTGILARNHEHLRRFAGSPRLLVRGDYTLNVANPLAAAEFMRRGVASLTCSCDLNAAQLADMLRAAPPAWFEVVIHQRMPLFHMEHCVFCAFLSNGRDFRDCGRPCEKHDVRLRDRVGMEHLVRADAACRNTVFNGRAQTGAEFAATLLALGVRRFRVEFTDDAPEAVAPLLDRYAALLRGEISGDALWRDLRLHSQLGVTRGTLK